MTDFCKNEDCPHSDELVEYERGGLDKTRGTEIRRHLAGCEFCDAEVEFYANYPQAAEEHAGTPAEIPEPLFELAEALLRNRHSDGASLNSLLKDKGRLVSDKV